MSNKRKTSPIAEEKAEKKVAVLLGSGASGKVYEGAGGTVIKRITNVSDGKREGFLHRYAYAINPLQVPKLISEREEDGVWILEIERLTGVMDDEEVSQAFEQNEELLKKFAQSFVPLLLSFHKADLLHGDLSQRNLFWDNERVKITDFGHSAVTPSRGLLDHLTPSDESAPESEVPEGGAYTIRSEWHAFGRILYELFTGARNWKDVMFDHAVLKKFPDLKDLLQKVMHPSETRRLVGGQILQHKWFQDSFPLLPFPSGYDKIGIDSKLFESKFHQWVATHDLRNRRNYYGFACLVQLALTEDGWVEGVHKKLKSLTFSEQLEACHAATKLVPCDFHLANALLLWIQEERILNSHIEFRKLLRKLGA